MATETKIVPKESSPPTAKSKPNLKSKKVILIIGTIFILLLCCATTCLCSGLSLAFFSNRSIPLLTESMETIEQELIDPRKQLETKQNDIASQIVEFLRPATEEDGMSYEEFLQQAEKLQQQEDSSRKPTKMSYEINIASFQEDDKDPSTSFDIDGEAHFDAENEATEMIMNLDIGTYGINLEGEIELIIGTDEENPTYYIKIVKFPLLDYLFESTDIEDKWIKVTEDDLEELTESSTSTSTDEEAYIKMSEEELDKVEEILKSDAILGDVKWEDSQTFEGNRAKCYSLNWREQEISEIVNDVVDAGFVQDQEEVDGLEELAESVDNISLYICEDRASGALYQARLTARFEYEDSSELNGYGFGSSKSSAQEKTYMDISANLIYGGYGEEYTVEIPTDTIDYDELMEELNQTSPYSDSFSYDDSYFDYDYDYEIEDFYTLYLDSSAESLRVERYVNRNQLSFDSYIMTYDIDEEKYAAESLGYICDSGLVEDCSPPLLVVIHTQQDYESEYIVGADEILRYLEANAK